MSPSTFGLADVLDRMALITQSLMDTNSVVNADSQCGLCLMNLERDDHDPDCGWNLARSGIAPADVAEVRRLARVLRYDRRARD